MPRRWTNSKGLGFDHETRENRALDRLRREVIPSYGRRNNKKNSNSNRRRSSRR